MSLPYLPKSSVRNAWRTLQTLLVMASHSVALPPPTKVIEDIGVGHINHIFENILFHHISLRFKKNYLLYCRWPVMKNERKEPGLLSRINDLKTKATSVGIEVVRYGFIPLVVVLGCRLGSDQVPIQHALFPL